MRLFFFYHKEISIRLKYIFFSAFSSLLVVYIYLEIIYESFLRLHHTFGNLLSKSLLEYVWSTQQFLLIVFLLFLLFFIIINGFLYLSVCLVSKNLRLYLLYFFMSVIFFLIWVFLWFPLGLSFYLKIFYNATIKFLPFLSSYLGYIYMNIFLGFVFSIFLVYFFIRLINGTIKRKIWYFIILLILLFFTPADVSLHLFFGSSLIFFLEVMIFIYYMLRNYLSVRLVER